MAKARSRKASVSIRGENVIGTINAGGQARLNINQKVIHQATPELDKLFKTLHEEIDKRPSSPPAAAPQLDKTDLQQQVKKIETEAAKGNAADQGKLEGWIR